MSLSQRAILFSLVFLICCLGQAQAQVRLDAEEAEKLAMEKPEPIYPPIAKAVRAEGIVKVEITVSEQGEVTSAKAITGHPLLQSAAVSAVKKRKYKAHTVDDKPVPFVTDVYIRFPTGALTGAQKQDYERQEELARQYFKEMDKCRERVRGQKWREAEAQCRVVVGIADQLSDDRALERMGAYEMFGHALRGRNRYREALEYYNRAFDAVRDRLKETDAELARLYGDMAITHHALRDLDKAREMYRKSARSYQLAVSDIGDERLAEQYRNSLKKILEFHLIAAEQAGATTEMEEVKKMLESIR